MIIDDVKYKLPINNFNSVESKKNKIIIGHTFNNSMKHFHGWIHRYHGGYKKTASFTIAKDGQIYKHFEPKFQSNFFKDKELDSKSIVILLENDGWLLKNIEKAGFYTWIGDTYDNSYNIVEKRWRGYNYWVSYSEAQIKSAVELVKILCLEFNIPKIVINHNTKMDNPIRYEGILYKSNFEKHFTDLSPAWDCNNFKELVEK